MLEAGLYQTMMPGRDSVAGDCAPADGGVAGSFAAQASMR